LDGIGGVGSVQRSASKAPELVEGRNRHFKMSIVKRNLDSIRKEIENTPSHHVKNYNLLIIKWYQVMHQMPSRPAKVQAQMIPAVSLFITPELIRS
jgi:hypothetical protein